MSNNFQNAKHILNTIRLSQMEDAAKFIASKNNLPYINIRAVGIDPDSLYTIKEEDARTAKIVPYLLKNKDLSVGVVNPRDPKTQKIIDDLKFKGYKLNISVISENSLKVVLDRYKDLKISKKLDSGLINIKPENFDTVYEQINTNDDINPLIQEAIKSRKNKITRILEILFAGAIKFKVSDIHIEPTEEEDALIKFREDGVLIKIADIDLKTYKMLVYRIKILSHLKITKDDIGQDGRFSVTFQGREIEVRTSVMPSVYGESVVLRVLDPEGLTLKFSELGFNQYLSEIIKREITKPNGLILTTGPTGSGKTTTLYSFLKYIYSPTKKIITVENPTEYHLEGIVQTQIDLDEGYTFSEGLKSALRHDPEVIMVGEIRDPETAKTAINAALTGHLVLSTLHTNDASGTIPRLLDLGITRDILISALTVSLGQRLVRRLCNKCKQEHKPDEYQKNIIGTLIKIAKFYGKNIEVDTPENIDDIIIYKPVGCSECSNTGYRGRIGVYEAILMDEEIEKIIYSDKMTERDIWRAASKQKILNMAEDGLSKVLKGITSFEEYISIIDAEGYIDFTIPEELKQEIQTQTNSDNQDNQEEQGKPTAENHKAILYYNEGDDDIDTAIKFAENIQKSYDSFKDREVLKNKTKRFKGILDEIYMHRSDKTPLHNDIKISDHIESIKKAVDKLPEMKNNNISKYIKNIKKSLRAIKPR